jgi:hypothetical protein
VGWKKSMFDSDIHLNYRMPNGNGLENLVFPQNVDLDRKHTEATGPRLPALEVLFDCVAADPKELYGSILNIDLEKSVELKLTLGDCVMADNPKDYPSNKIVQFSRTPLPALQP